MEINRKYPIVAAERVDTKYGPRVLLSVKDEPHNIVKVYLTRRYSARMSEEDINSINAQKVLLHLVYKGVCDKTQSFIVGIE